MKTVPTDPIGPTSWNLRDHNSFKQFVEIFFWRPEKTLIVLEGYWSNLNTIIMVPLLWLWWRILIEFDEKQIRPFGNAFCYLRFLSYLMVNKQIGNWIGSEYQPQSLFPCIKMAALDEKQNIMTSRNQFFRFLWFLPK